MVEETIKLLNMVGEEMGIKVCDLYSEDGSKLTNALGVLCFWQ